ncbi:MAG: histone deacetylase [Myxococcales bacterium]|nr:histone deacetylase [Myxococcales bacterium]
MQAKWGLPRVRLVYHPAYRLPEDPLVDNRRGERILEYLALRRWIDLGTVLRPERLRVGDLLRVHGADYLSRLDDPKELERVFGGRPHTTEVATRLLEAQRWATSGTVLATSIALRYPWIRSPVYNLGGGYHHARRDQGTGFCAFNDVAVAVDRARADGFSGKVLIVDLDAHQGDGTRSMFADDERVTTFSIHGEAWDRTPVARAIDVALGPAVGDETYLRTLEAHLDEAFVRADPALVFFLAGTDVAIGDPLGGFRLSAQAIATRDQMVLERAKGTPTVVLLAGGYGPDTWRYTARTLVWLLSGEDRPILSSDEKSLASFRRIRTSLSSSSLSNAMEGQGGDELALTDADIYADLMGKDADPRFLSFYSGYGLEVAFERYGLAEHLRSRGYHDFEISPEPPRRGGGQGLRVYANATKHDILIELLVDEVLVDGARMLSIEWLLLQDAWRKPPPGEPLLPGQKHPGLGCLAIVIGMLVMAAERLGYEGLTVVPSHYHVAAQARRLFAFLDPTDEAFFLALSRATHGRTLFEASKALAAGEVVDDKGVAVSWKPSRMVLATGENLKARLASAAYARAVEAAARELRPSRPPPEVPRAAASSGPRDGEHG